MLALAQQLDEQDRAMPNKRDQDKGGGAARRRRSIPSSITPGGVPDGRREL